MLAAVLYTLGMPAAARLGDATHRTATRIRTRPRSNYTHSLTRTISIPTTRPTQTADPAMWWPPRAGRRSRPCWPLLLLVLVTLVGYARSSRSSSIHRIPSAAAAAHARPPCWVPHACGSMQQQRSLAAGAAVGRRGPGATMMQLVNGVLPELDREEIQRYSRHLILSQVGVEGQRRLKGAKVFCVGAGGLGSPALLYLAAAGIGTIGIIDDDVVDVSNLQRQVIHGQTSLDEPKVESARRRILDVNPHVNVVMYREKLGMDNILRLLEPYDVVVDGTDNFPTRYLVNDACVMLGKPLVYGAILRFEGQASVFNYQGGPNYRDLLPEPPAPGDVPSCAEGGVLGVLPGVIGCIQATEAIKLLTGIGKPLSGRVLLYNALEMAFREVTLLADPDAPKITSLVDYNCGCLSAAPAEQPQQQEQEPQPEPFQRVSVADARRALEQGWAPFVLDVRLPQEADIVRLPFSDRLCPHREVERIAAELPRDRDILVYCKVGGRSAQACQKLAELGFTNVVNLDGGIIAWAKEVDERMPVY